MLCTWNMKVLKFHFPTENRFDVALEKPIEWYIFFLVPPLIVNP